MKHQMRHGRSARLATGVMGSVAAFCGLVVPAGAGGVAQLLSNGGFDEVLVDWSTPAALEPWIPYQPETGSVSLHPDVGMYMGPVLSQGLNVTEIAGRTVTGSIDLGCPWALSAGNSVVVYLIYLDDTGAERREALVRPDNTAIPVGVGMATFSRSFTFPPDAAKLVGIEIAKEDWGQVYADNVSLTADQLSTGPVPHLVQLSPASVSYGGVFTLQGSGFGGATAPVVEVNGSAAGLQVTGWTESSVTVAVSPPAVSGVLEVSVAGTLAGQRRKLTVESPHFVALAADPRYTTVPGLTVEVPVWVELRNGFTAPGGVTLQVMNGASVVPSSFSPAINGTGGTLVSIPTTSLTAGVNHLAIRATAGAFVAPDSFFDVLLEIPASAQFSVYGVPIVGAYNATAQGVVSTYMTLLDAGGEALETVPKFTLSSTNPSVCDVFLENRPWGGPNLLVNDNGSAVIHAYGPGGLHYQLPVNVAVPHSPKMTMFSIGMMPVMNSGADERTLFIQVNVPIGSVSYGWGDVGITTGIGYWGENSYSVNYAVSAGALPGDYLLNGSASGVTRSAKMVVVNDPSKGLVSGQVVSFANRGMAYMHEQVIGTLEFYDTSGNKVSPGAGSGDLSIFEWGKEYHACYLDPGVYRLRWVPDTQTGSEPKWWPNADSFAEAAPVTVAAGGEVTGIHFFFGAPPETAPEIVGPPQMVPAENKFRIPVQTVSGTTYLLQRSDLMLDGTWYTVGQIWGDGGVQTLEDANATSGRGFYRVTTR